MRTAAAFLLLGFSAAAQSEDGEAIYKMHCASCHESAASHAPGLDILRRMYPEPVLRTLESGSMKTMAASLSSGQRRAVALFVAGKPFGNAPELASKAAYCTVGARDLPETPTGSSWNGWSPDLANTRFQAEAGIRAGDVPRLKLSWAFGFPGATVANGQPSLAYGRVFVGSANRAVYSLDAKTGCLYWMYEASAGVRAAITVGKTSKLARPVAFFGDGRAYVYALDAATGDLIWKINVEQFPSARITGSPQLYADKLYVPVSIVEEGLAINPRYECCKSRPSVVALDASTGKEIWRFRTIQEEVRQNGKSANGTQLWGPSGASIWSAPALDPENNALYFGTGNNHSNPPTRMSDAIVAIRMDTGRLLWARQITANDAYNVACVRPDRSNCPEPGGPDFDFGSSPILVRLRNRKPVLLAGQKSGVMTALDPSDGGKLLWQTRVGKGGLLGGIQWGSASDGDLVYVPVSDIAWLGERILNPTLGGGLFALQIATGEKVWAAPLPDCGARKNCSPAQSSAVSAITGAVFSGSVDGHLRAYSTKDGKVIWDFDTARDFETVNQAPGKGGSMDGPGPAIGDGMVFVPSGYGSWGGLPGNVLLAFSVDRK